MFLFKTAAGLRSHLERIQEMGHTVGFVPTMGALHEGHAALIRHSLEEGHYTVVSIYVNPTQFNDPEDLKKYPRPVSDDLQFLCDLGCPVVFLPSDDEMYPKGKSKVPAVDLGLLNSTLEAAFRPGHFEGVLQVVYRLLDIIRPDYLFMGKKDFQQLAVIQRLLQNSPFSCLLIGLPIAREENGLARSSRNERLSYEQRLKASVIYNTLLKTAGQYPEKTLESLKNEALNLLNKDPFRPEYFEFVREDNMRILDQKEDYEGIVYAVTAVWCGKIRLIDNMEMPNKEMVDR